jgi:hypothetical protein
MGGRGGSRTHVPVLPDHPISNRRRYDLFGTLPKHRQNLAFFGHFIKRCYDFLVSLALSSNGQDTSFSRKESEFDSL